MPALWQWLDMWRANISLSSWMTVPNSEMKANVSGQVKKTILWLHSLKAHFSIQAHVQLRVEGDSIYCEHALLPLATPNDHLGLRYLTKNMNIHFHTVFKCVKEKYIGWSIVKTIINHFITIVDACIVSIVHLWDTGSCFIRTLQDKPVKCRKVLHPHILLNTSVINWATDSHIHWINCFQGKQYQI